MGDIPASYVRKYQRVLSPSFDFFKPRSFTTVNHHESSFVDVMNHQIKHTNHQTTNRRQLEGFEADPSTVKTEERWARWPKGHVVHMVFFMGGRHITPRKLNSWPLKTRQNCPKMENHYSLPRRELLNFRGCDMN